jgi:hypothetical protein
MAVAGLLHTRTLHVARAFKERSRTVGEVGQGEKERVISVEKGPLSALSGDTESTLDAYMAHHIRSILQRKGMDLH